MPQLELRGERDERLGVAEEEIAALDQAVVETADHHLLRSLVEIDDHVATEDDVDVAEERDARVVVEVEAAERDAVADLVADAPRAVGLAREVALAQRGIGGAEGVLAILPAPRLGQHGLIDVAGEN